MMLNNITVVQMWWLSLSTTKKARMNKGDIKKKDIIFNYRYAGGDVTVYELTGKQLKEYMEWSANYFDTIQPGDTEYRYKCGT